MTEVSRPILTFSAATPEDSEKAPMLVQVSMVTTVARPMSSDEFEKAMEWISKSKDVVKKTFKKGKDFYDKHNIGGAIKAIAGVGDIVGGIMKFLPDEQDPMVQKLANLETDVKELGEKLTQNFKEMKEFITEESFIVGIITPTSVLTKYMRDCLRDPNEQAKENFRKSYNKLTPLTLQYNLMGYLEHNSTNPLRLSMNNEKVKTKATFEKWEDMICRVMAQFMFLEAFATGLLGIEESDSDRLLDSSNEIFGNLTEWRQEYEKDQNYWQELKDKFEQYIIKSANLGNAQRAQGIKQWLDGYLTTDAFYFCIFGDVKWNEKYTYYCPNEKDQIIGAWNKGRCNAFIYRSRQGSTRSQEDYATLRQRAIECQNGKLRWSGSLHNTIKNQLIDQSLLHGYGFICLIDVYADPQVFYLNSLEPDWLNKGPGHMGFALMDNNNDKKQFRFIVSFN